MPPAADGGQAANEAMQGLGGRENWRGAGRASPALRLKGGAYLNAAHHLALQAVVGSHRLRHRGVVNKGTPLGLVELYTDAAAEARELGGPGIQREGGREACETEAGGGSARLGKLDAKSLAAAGGGAAQSAQRIHSVGERLNRRRGR